MAVYSVEGKLGTGKTKFCVWRAQLALREGRRVASNVDLYLDKLVPEMRKAAYQRIPDKPTSHDLHAIGHGNPESYDEDRNGVLILDELGSWLNSRSFQDKDRMGVIDWMIHARKLGWDVYLIVQDAGMIDRQVRDALIEYQCRCVRLDKVKIPIFGSLLSAVFGKKAGYLPRMHFVGARVGSPPIVAERWYYRGDDLHAAYDTRQVFVSNPGDVTRTVLHPQRFDQVEPGRVGWLKKLLSIGRYEKPKPVVRPVKKNSVLDLLQKLPPEERLKHFKRLQALGAI